MTAPAWHPLSGTLVRTPRCECEQGMCGHCTNGNHEQCYWVRDSAAAALRDAEPISDWLIDRKGYVPTFPNGRVARVYLDNAGAHKWRCSCHAQGHDGALEPAQPPLDLFGEVTA